MISIIVPVYKVEEFLPQCIESIINQTYRDIEVILIDDGSPDNCGTICEEYAKRDKRIRVFHKENGGLSEARNYGIVRATGEYVGFVDSDDWIEPNMYEVLVNIAKEKQADIVGCSFFFEYPKKTLARKIIEKDFDNNIELCKALIYDEVDTSLWTKLYHKSCFENVIFPNGHVSEDIVTMYQFFLNVKSVVTISKPLYHYRQMREGAITQTRSMVNLIDCWLAHKARYDYFSGDSRFNTDNEIMDKLYYYCAYAIGRTWGWSYKCSDQEKIQYDSTLKEMHDFCIQNFPKFGMKEWPLSVRIPIVIGRLNNSFAFALLYFVMQSYRWTRDKMFR